MSTVITFTKKIGSGVKAEKNEIACLKNKAILTEWVDENVSEINNGVDILIECKHIETLLPEMKERLSGLSGVDSDDKVELKEIVDTAELILKTVDFEIEDLLFNAWW